MGRAENLLRDMMAHVQGLISHADSKAQINVAIASLIFSGLALSGWGRGALPVWARVLYFCSMGLLFASIIVSLFSLTPSTRSSGRNLFSFTTYAEEPLEEIIDELAEYDSDASLYKRKLVDEVKILSEIAIKKFSYIKVAVCLMLCGVFFAALFVLTSILR